MPIWLNVVVVLLMGLLVLWGMRGLAKSIDHSMENSEADDAPGLPDASGDKGTDDDR